MEPFYFESLGTELLGIYHPASNPSARRGVVICPPLMTDLSRCYRSIRLLAEDCASAGYEVLRFDYSGTGDSFGDWDDAGPTQWIEDIVKATEELSEISGAELMTLAGVRFGGLLALHAAERTKPESLMLWDPVENGSDYRANLEAIHEGLANLHIGLSDAEKRRAALELCGFNIAPWMASELEELQAPQSIPDSVERISLVNTLNCSNFSDIDQLWAREGRKISCRQVEFECSWNESPEEIMNPSPVLKELALCL